MQRHPAFFKAHGAACEVEPVGAQRFFGLHRIAAFNQQVFGLLQLGFQRIGPVPQRAGIVGVRVLQIQQLETGPREVRRQRADMQQLPARKDVFFYEVPHARAQLPVVQSAGCDAVVQHQSSRGEQTLDFGEVPDHVDLPDMLHHANRGDFVKGTVFSQVALVIQGDVHAVCQAPVLNQLRHMLVLVFGQGDAGGLHAVVFGRPQLQGTPASANVQKALRWLQHQLAADFSRWRHQGSASVVGLPGSSQAMVCMTSRIAPSSWTLPST